MKLFINNWLVVVFFLESNCCSLFTMKSWRKRKQYMELTVCYDFFPARTLSEHAAKITYFCYVGHRHSVATMKKMQPTWIISLKSLKKPQVFSKVLGFCGWFVCVFCFFFKEGALWIYDNIHKGFWWNYQSTNVLSMKWTDKGWDQWVTEENYRKPDTSRSWQNRQGEQHYRSRTQLKATANKALKTKASRQCIRL